jgi:hypothetical protein
LEEHGSFYLSPTLLNAVEPGHRYRASALKAIISQAYGPVALLMQQLSDSGTTVPNGLSSPV